MSYLPSRSLRAVGTSRRYASGLAVSLGEASYHHASSSIKLTSGAKSQSSVALMMDSLPSQSCIGNLSVAYSSSLKPYVPRGSSLIKRNIINLLENRKYEQVLDLLLRWTESSVNNSWKSTISEREMAFFIGAIVKYQLYVIAEAADAKGIHRDINVTHQKFAEARSLREKIRGLYSILLYGSTEESLYERLKRANVYNSDHYTGYLLTQADYENLISLELGNQKLDLASKWFQRFHSQFEEPLTKYTYDMWVLKFKVYCGGAPFLWTSPKTDVGRNDIRRRRGIFRAEKPWIEVFDEYLRTILRTTNSQPVLDNKMNEVLISCMGYNGSLSYLTKYIESVWGITAQGKSKFRLEKSNSRYPDLAILKAIVVSFFYNQQFFQAMTYLNSFQEIYGIDLTISPARSLWDQVFRYAEGITSYDEDKALSVFLKQSRINVDTKRKKEDKLRQVQSNVNFDYEGYLTFVKDLEQKRTATMSELWHLYRDSNGFFCTGVVKAYLSFLEVKPSSMDQYYDLMTYLAKCYHEYAVSNLSFNRLDLITNRIYDNDERVYALYEQALANAIEIKGILGYIGQIEPLIEEWSLDNEMAHKLRAKFMENRPRYRSILEENRLRKVEEQVEDEEKLLDLF
ncbi:hypothetical protein QFC19_005651 [Naganishia cerealis]|uniref:Uncharacterized protein n=1 Tax=Naganishia cerealis TaxID=610337 RepID=A0ACC2VLY4_9TREE|nr:hypothetical protein QFC19_005651 [Naganishia cerealis]